MLEHVALGQARFRAPGISPDPRGIALGRFGLLVFPSLEGVVSWFRVFSAESSLDELMSALAIHRLVTPLGSRSVAIRLPAISSYVLDRAARCAKLVGGITYTGSAKHYVKFRDESSPFGYDTADIPSIPDGRDLVCHDETFTQEFTKEGEISFTTLLFRLSLRKLPRGRALRSQEREELLVSVAPGLADGIIRYLWRNKVDADAALVKPKGDSDFSDAPKSYLVLAVRDLPARILELFLGTPGVDVFRRVSTNVAVELGYDHVIGLGACASLFPEDKVYFFRGNDDRVDIVAGPLETSPIASLVPVEISNEQPLASQNLVVDTSPLSTVHLKLAPTQSSPRNVVGSLVPVEQASWVKKLVFMMPRASLREHQIAITARGILLVAQPGTEILPIGDLLTSITTGVLVPVGFDIVPRVSPAVLINALKQSAGQITVFAKDGAPFRIQESDLSPLERMSVADIEVESATLIVEPEPARDPMVVNDAVGRFALWGFPEPDNEQQS